ncbi:MAG: hypothetical protein PVJ86_06505 [Phycisphaerales bacterium]
MQIIAGYRSKASKKPSCNADDLIYPKVYCRKGLPEIVQRDREVNMAKNEYSQYQKAVISGYYNNLDAIMLQKLGELVTELYLADTQAKQERLWQRTHKAMVKLKVPPAIIDHIMERKDVEILAKNLEDWRSTNEK